MNAQAMQPRRGVYLLTPDEPDTARLLGRLAPLLAGGAVALLQLRNKDARPALLRQQALALLPLCRAAQVPLGQGPGDRGAGRDAEHGRVLERQPRRGQRA